jgi:hypothetical protein
MFANIHFCVWTWEVLRSTLSFRLCLEKYCISEHDYWDSCLSFTFISCNTLNFTFISCNTFLSMVMYWWLFTFEEYYLWDIVLKVSICFRGTYRPHIQGQRISQARYQCKNSKQAQLALHATCFLSFFYPEDGANMFLRNVTWHAGILLILFFNR